MSTPKRSKSREKSNKSNGQRNKRKYCSSDSTDCTQECSVTNERFSLAKQHSTRKEKRTNSAGGPNDFKIQNEISYPIPTAVTIPRPYQENSNAYQVEGQLAKWMTKGELLTIAERYDGLAIQYRAKYHSGQPVKDSAPLPGYSLKKYKALPDKPKIKEGDLVVQSRFVSANGNNGGLTYSLKNFRLPGNLRARHRSIYQSTRPNLVVPRELNACPLFVLDESLSLHDRKVVKTFLISGVSGKSPSQTYPDLQIHGGTKAASGEANGEEETGHHHDHDQGLDIGDSSHSRTSLHSSSSINNASSCRLTESPTATESAPSADCEHFELSSPSVADNAAITKAHAEAEETDLSSVSSLQQPSSDSSMDCVPFIPSSPRLDAKPKRSILRKRKVTKLSSQYTNSQKVTPIRLGEESPNFVGGNGAEDEEKCRVDCEVPDTIEQSVDCLENTAVITPHTSSKRNEKADLYKIQKHRALVDSVHATMVPQKQRRISYGKRHRRFESQQISFQVTEGQQNFCFVEEALENQNVEGFKWGRVLELPGSVMAGKWISELVEYEPGKGHIEPNIKISFRNKARSVPFLGTYMDQDGIDIYTIRTSSNRVAQFLDQRDTAKKDPIPYKHSPPTSLRSISLAAFEGFTSTSDLRERCPKVAEMILGGQQTTSGETTRLLPISTNCNKEVESGYDSNPQGVCFKHHLGIESNILVHVAREEGSGLIVAVDVVTGKYSDAIGYCTQLNKKNLARHRQILDQSEASSSSSEEEGELLNVSRLEPSCTNSLQHGYYSQPDADPESRHSMQSSIMGGTFSKHHKHNDANPSEHSSLTLEFFQNTETSTPASRLSTTTSLSPSSSSDSGSFESTANASRSTRARSISQSVGASTVLRIAGSRSRAVRVNLIGGMASNVGNIEGSSIESSVEEEEPSSNVPNTASGNRGDAHSRVNEQDDNEQDDNERFFESSYQSPLRQMNLVFGTGSPKATRFAQQGKLDTASSFQKSHISHHESSSPKNVPDKTGLAVGHNSEIIIRDKNSQTDKKFLFRPTIASYKGHTGSSHSHFTEEESPQNRSCNVLNNVLFGVQDDDEHESTLMQFSNSDLIFEEESNKIWPTPAVHEFLFRDGTCFCTHDDCKLYQDPFILIQNMFFGGLFDAEECQELHSTSDADHFVAQNDPTDYSASAAMTLNALMHIFHYGPADSVSIKEFDRFCDNQQQHNNLPLQNVFYGVHDDDEQHDTQMTTWNLAKLDHTNLIEDCDDSSDGGEDVDKPWLYVSFSDILLFFVSLFAN